MRKLLTLSAAICLLPVAALAQSPGEILGSAAAQVPTDIFECRKGLNPCNLQVRVYNEMDPTDFFGTANPVNGFPRFSKAAQRYVADAQLTGNYPTGGSMLDLNWYTAWDGVTSQDTFEHVGYYGAQSQVVSYSELGNPNTATCLPIAGQYACFLALTTASGQDISQFGPSRAALRTGGLSPLPRPEVISTSPTQVQLSWEESVNLTMNDGAPNPVLGYRLYFHVGDPVNRVGPSETQLAAALAGSTLIEATPGVVIPRTTTSFTLSTTDPILASFDPATQSLVAVLKIVYAHEVDSLYFSANSFPFTFTSLVDRVTEFRTRLDRDGVALSWTVDSVAGLRGFNVLRSDQVGGTYFPVDRNDILVDGSGGVFATFDRLLGRSRSRNGSESVFYRLELNGLDGSRLTLAPVEVDIRSIRRGRGVH